MENGAPCNPSWNSIGIRIPPSSAIYSADAFPQLTGNRKQSINQTPVATHPQQYTIQIQITPIHNRKLSTADLPQKIDSDMKDSELITLDLTTLLLSELPSDLFDFYSSVFKQAAKI